MQQKIIAISGKKTAGKTTLANLLRSEVLSAYTTRAPIISLAGGIRSLLYTYLGIGSLDKDAIILGLSYREWLQKTGQAMRDIHPSFWLHHWRTKAIKDGSSIVLVDDVRYQNEVEFFKKNNALLIRLKRNWFNDDSHPSEVEMNGIPDEVFDVVVPEMEEVTENTEQEERAMTPDKVLAFVKPKVEEYLRG